MKTLAQPRYKAEIVRRLTTVRPGSARRWGRMSPHQMTCHLSDSCRVATGQKTVSEATGGLQRALSKWTALYLPLGWPPAIPTRRGLDRHVRGTRRDDPPPG